MVNEIRFWPSPLFSLCGIGIPKVHIACQFKYPKGIREKALFDFEILTFWASKDGGAVPGNETSENQKGEFTSIHPCLASLRCAFTGLKDLYGDLLLQLLYSEPGLRKLAENYPV